jgi:calcium-dependent protein kinase
MLKYADTVVEVPSEPEKQKPHLEKLPSSYSATSEKEHSECGAKEPQEHQQAGDSTSRAAQCGDGELRISHSHFVFERKDSIADSYELLDLISEGNATIHGAGSFGAVYKALHKLSGDMRAVKKVEKAMMNQKQEEQLCQEFNILKMLVKSQSTPRTTHTS